MENLYDAKCHELADHFLGDDDVPNDENELRIQSLAAAVQRAVEEWMEEEGTRDRARSSPAPEGSRVHRPKIDRQESSVGVRGRRRGGPRRG